MRTNVATPATGTLRPSLRQRPPGGDPGHERGSL